ncbi:MAG: FAD-dependent oxidoreductase [Anaerolineales bacterium]|nr:FAD-dependent oxidoreductase [Anaerolineales bacterium]
MSSEQSKKAVVAVVGAGPAGLYAAEELANNGVEVALINRDIKPGGLAEYGIYKDKYKMKSGLRRQFDKILAHESVHYFGNVSIGQKGVLSLDDLRQMDFTAVLVTVGAQGTKWLGLPGEALKGVYHAKDLVYHYNKLPPFSEQSFYIGRRVAIIGVGNVMLDIAHWVIRDLKVDEVTAVARRGPADVKFTKKEMQAVAENLDLEFLQAEIERSREQMTAAGQDPQEAHDFILSALNKADTAVSDTRFRLLFRHSPRRILGNEEGFVTGLEMDKTDLVPRGDGRTGVQNSGETEVLPVDTVIFAIGDTVDPSLGLPTDKWNDFAKNPTPRFPIDDISYEVYDPQSGAILPDIFIAGWAREASSGLVGAARKDGTRGAKAVLQYIATLPATDCPSIAQLRNHLIQNKATFVTQRELVNLTTAEQALAATEGLEEFKYSSNKEMLEIIFGAQP